MHSIELIQIPAGTFKMGSEEGCDDERPVHTVSLNAFRIAIHPVTNEQYSKYLQALEPGCHQASTILEGFNDPHQPVTSVSWFDAIEFCKWLEGETQIPYRLPTEAEWEYAACSGDPANVYAWGRRNWNESPELHSCFQTGPERVCKFKPNHFGIHDMCLNVHEWCSDWYDSRYYAVSTQNNPQGPKNGTRRSSRGGSWRHQIKITRCAARSSIPPAMRYADYGVRLAV